MGNDLPKPRLSEDRIKEIARYVSRRYQIHSFTSEDVYLEAFVKMWEEWKEGNEEVSEGYLVNKARNHLRALRRANSQDEHSFPSNEVQDHSPSSLNQLSSEETFKLLEGFLSEKEHRLITSLFIEGNTDQDVCKELGYTWGSYRNAKCRAIKKIREHLLTERDASNTSLT
jgi:RNA polymerase sigma factor (sigma-70 family)